MQDVSQYTVADQARLILGAGNGLVELRALHPRLGTIKQKWFGADELDYLERRVASLAPSYDVYLGAAARRRAGGKACDVAYAAALFADCDSLEAARALRDFRPYPTLVVRTSDDRYHAYWALARPLSVDDLKPVLARLCAALKSDRTGVDVARVLRAVGTVNHKRSEDVTCAFFSGEVHDIDTVLAACPLVLERDAGPGRGEHTPMSHVPRGERHNYIVDFAVRLVRGGITDQACVESHLWHEFERVCEPLPAPTGLGDIAAWAVDSEIARRERERGERDTGFAGMWRKSA